MITDLPIDERPRERLLALGCKDLSTMELLAIIVGKGSRGKSALSLAAELLERFGSANGIMNATIPELCEITGIGEAKAIGIKACFELGLRSQKPSGQMRYPVYAPEDVYRYIRNRLEHAEVEQMIAVLRDGRGQIFHCEQVAQGRANCVHINQREILSYALRHRASGFILCHNHPTGNPEPSKADIDLTRKMYLSGGAIGIPLDDHLIIGRSSFTSLYRQQYLEKRYAY